MTGEKASDKSFRSADAGCGALDLCPVNGVDVSKARTCRIDLCLSDVEEARRSRSAEQADVLTDVVAGKTASVESLFVAKTR